VVEEAYPPLLVANLNDSKIDAEMFLFVVDGAAVVQLLERLLVGRRGKLGG